VKISALVTVEVSFSKTYKKRKYHYGYQFVSHGGELRFRGLTVQHYGRVKDYQKTTGPDWNQVLFLYPGMQTCILDDTAWGGLLITKKDLPEDIRDLTQRKDIVIPKAVKEAAQRKVNITVSDEFAKR
jgi:hypothetical protein